MKGKNPINEHKMIKISRLFCKVSDTFLEKYNALKKGERYAY